VDLKIIPNQRHNLNFHLTNDKVASSLSSAVTQLTYEIPCCYNTEVPVEKRTQTYGKSNGLAFPHILCNLEHVRAVLGNDPLQPSNVLGT
jgi:hypothetical protein